MMGIQKPTDVQQKIMFLEIALSVLLLKIATAFDSASTERQMENFPLVMVVLLARDKAGTLPHFLTYFDHLNYPKDRLALHIRADHSQDRTIDIIEDWLHETRHKYHSVDDKLERGNPLYKNETRREKFGAAHLKHVIHLKEHALLAAKLISAGYVWFLDVDVFVTNKNTLVRLIHKDKAIAAAVLSSVYKYTNFVAFDADDTDNENDIILDRRKLGCFEVPFASECILIDIRKSGTEALTFLPSIPEDYGGVYQDLLEFSYSAEAESLAIHVCNDENYGYVMPEMLAGETFLNDKATLVNLKVHMIKDDVNIQVVETLEKYVELPQVKGKLGFGEIYSANLKRRPDRRRRMKQMFKVIGVEYRRVEAIDGRDLNASVLTELGITPIPGYRDTVLGRPMTFGEVGCAVTHYTIWEDVLRHGYDEVMVVEDDIYFLPDFATNVQKLREEIAQLHLEWDFIYLDRHNLSGKPEQQAFNSSLLVEPGFSYLTTGYFLSRSGAEKLVAGDPLRKLLPVDEYLPIMYNQPYMNSKFESPHLDLFPVRNLKAFAVVDHLLLQIFDETTPGYISDTETSSFVEEDFPPSISLRATSEEAREHSPSLQYLETSSRCLKFDRVDSCADASPSSMVYPSLLQYLNQTRI